MKFKIGIYIALMILGLIVISFCCCLTPLICKFQKRMCEDSRELLFKESIINAERISGILTEKFDIVKVLARQLESAEDVYGDSYSIAEMERLVLSYIQADANNECKAYWIEYELEHLSEKEKMNLPLSSREISGQVLLLAQRWGKDPVVEKIILDASKHEYYKPFKSREADYYITEPTNYAYLTKDDLVVSIARPLIYNGKMVGACGLDINTVGLKEDIAGLSPFDAGYARLLSKNLLVIADGNDVEKRGHSLIGDKEVEQRVKAVAEDGAWSGVARNMNSGEEEFVTSVAVSISDSDLFWIFENVLPAKYIDKRVDMTIGGFIYYALGVLLLALVCAFIICYWIVSRIRNYENLFKQILDAINLPVSVLDNENIVVLNNVASEELLNIREGDRVDYKSVNAGKYNKIVKEGLYSGIDRLVSTGKGRADLNVAGDKWVVDCQYLFDSNNNRAGVVSIMNDISLHNHLEDITQLFVNMTAGLQVSSEKVALTVQELMESASSHVDSLEKLSILFAESLNSDKIDENDNNYSALSNGVIKQIGGIVSQSNLLAVNVHSESQSGNFSPERMKNIIKQVQNLAQRSAEAAEEIASVIDRGNEEIGVRSEIIKLAYVSISRLIDRVENIHTLVSNISVVSLQQYEEIKLLNSHLEEVAEYSKLTKQKSQHLLVFKKLSALYSDKNFENIKVDDEMNEVIASQDEKGHPVT